MEFASFNSSEPDVLFAAAVHDGHDLRPEIAANTALDEDTRRREEDPHTGSIAAGFPNSVVVHRSRFEVDLNRERDEAVYRVPDDAWGLELWQRSLSEEQVSASLVLYDRFYLDLAASLDRLVGDHGGFVLYDIHSYNHRRLGPAADPDPADESPVVNLGTGSLPEKWKPVADALIESLRSYTFDGARLDARENVRFEGRQVARWVHENYGDVGCALAIEMKKVFMDEWTGELDPGRLAGLGDVLIATGPDVRTAWGSA
ncbi:MAG: N-formylglutamate amidohydrolase [Acidimicrobiia bacterium]